MKKILAKFLATSQASELLKLENLQQARLQMCRS